MEICRDDAGKIVEIWLRRDEAGDPPLQEALRSVIAEYKRQKYLVAVYASGSGELRAGVGALLLQQLHASAQEPRTRLSSAASCDTMLTTKPKENG